jgi:hypothetical protein
LSQAHARKHNPVPFQRQAASRLPIVFYEKTASANATVSRRADYCGIRYAPFKFRLPFWARSLS